MTYLLGLDAGLTSVKAAVFDREGTEVAVASRETPEDRPAPGHVEQDPDALWNAAADAIRDVLSEVDADGVEGVGIAGHGHGLYLLDSAGAPARPGIKSTDSRALGIVGEWEDAGLVDEFFAIAGYEPFGADPLSLLAWVKREEPGTYDAVKHVLFCKDYLKYRLAGRVCTDEMESSAFYDLDRGEYARDLLATLGLDACFDALPPVVPSWEACGEVTADAADATGLSAGTPVASGLHDVGATALGAGVRSSGQAMLIVGTWGQSIVVRDAPDPDREAGGITRRYLDGGWLEYKGNRSAAACVDWFVEECAADWRARAEEAGASPYEVYNRAVADVPPGADGVLFHPYLSGSTDDPDARGGFYGLRTDHTKSHLLRAIYEGVAVAQAERLDELERGLDVDDVRIGGGGARSEVWMGIFADVFDEAIRIPAGTEFGARGAAMCAGIATGTYDGHADAVERAVSMDREHAPDPGRVETYRRLREVFERAADDIAPTWEGLTDLSGEG